MRHSYNMYLPNNICSLLNAMAKKIKKLLKIDTQMAQKFELEFRNGLQMTSKLVE